MRTELPERSEGRDRPKAVIAPSILSSDFARLGNECKLMLELGADWLHVDIMDGHFVPNLTIGPPVVKSLRKHTDGFLDCHLMVSNPSDWVKSFAEAGADMFTFHLEAISDLSPPGKTDNKVVEFIKEVRNNGMYVGMAIKPSTSVDNVMPYVQDLDLVLVLTVEPGFGGQSFMADKVKKCKQIRSAFPDVLIEVDGGLSPDTIDAAAAEGANVIVAGSAIFGAEDPAAVISILRESVDAAATSQSGK